MSEARMRRLLEAAVVAAAVVLAVIRFFAIDATSHSNSDTLRPWIIQVTVIAALAWAIIWGLERIGRPKGD
jgi:hypothetical protein